MNEKSLSFTNDNDHGIQPTSNTWSYPSTHIEKTTKNIQFE